MGDLPDRGESEGRVASYVFFVDRSLGRHDVPDALQKAGEKVERHDVHFPERTDDVDWLRLVSKHDWVVLTKDSEIKHRPLERAAVRRGKVRQFTYQSAQTKGEDMASAFVKALPKMKKLLKKHDGPFIAKVYKDGRVEMWDTF